MKNSLHIPDNPIQVVGGIIMNDNDEIFLCRNRQGFFVLPGGKVDTSDIDHIESLKREIFEELDRLHIPRGNIRPYKIYQGVSPEGNTPIEISTYIFSLVAHMERIVGKGEMILSVVNTAPDSPQLEISGEVSSGKFYSIEDILIESSDVLGAATSGILKDIQQSQRAILDVANKVSYFIDRADKQLVGADRSKSMEFYQNGGVLGFTMDSLKKREYKKEIESLISLLPNIDTFIQDEGGRLGDLFLFGKDSHEKAKGDIYNLLTLGTYIGKTRIIPQVSEIRHFEEFQANDVINNIRFQVLD